MPRTIILRFVEPDVAAVASRMIEDAERDRIYATGVGLNWDGTAYAIGHGEPDDARFDEDQ